VSELFDNLLFIFQRLNWLSVLDILLVTAIFFTIFMFLRNTQAMVLLRGALLLFIFISLLIAALPLPAFSWLVSSTVPVLLLAIPVIFATEIRRVLGRLGRAGAILPSERRRVETLDVISAVVHASARLSNRRHGALIVMERLDSLHEYVETGVTLESEVSAELLLQVFYPNTPLHDGAVIISGTSLLGAACVMPLSSSGVLADNPERKMGLRHRAALGTSEVSDAVVVVISEENGAISLAYGGRMIHRLDAERLENILRAFFGPSEAHQGLEGLIYRWFPFLEPRPETPVET